MKNTAASDAAIAAFLAKRNVTKVAVGTSSGFTDRQFFLASRGDISLCDVVPTEQVDERYLERVREAKHCGASDREALDDASIDVEIWSKQ